MKKEMLNISISSNRIKNDSTNNNFESDVDPEPRKGPIGLRNSISNIDNLLMEAQDMNIESK